MGSHDLFRHSREAGIQYVNYAKRKNTDSRLGTENA
jgi:hypothetical protein